MQETIAKMNQQMIIEDVEMAEIDVINSEPRLSLVNNTNQTPNLMGSFDSSSHLDSGYLSMTPQSISLHDKPMMSIGTRSRTSRNSSNTTCFNQTTANNINQNFYWLRNEKKSPAKYDRKSRSRSNNDSACDNSLIDDFDVPIYQQYHQYSLRNHDSIVEKKLLSNNFSKDRQHFKTELREYRSRSKRYSNPSSAAVTPASSTKVSSSQLSTPLSPSIGGSAASTCFYTACEPIEQEIANKLVIQPPYSTPFTNSCMVPNSTELIRSSMQITCSPKTSKTSQFTSSSSSIAAATPIKNLEIKCKRLDFGAKTGINHGYYNRQRNIDYTGKDTVDILSLLGEKRNYPRTISKIFSCLRPQDLCAVSMVSRSWRRLCLRDNLANQRRQRYIICGQNTKENNVHLILTGTSTPKAKKLYNHLNVSPKVKLVKRTYFTDVQNTQVTPTKRMIPARSPPVSPSKVKFHSFVKASRSLAPSERLFRCPKCFFACRMDMEKNVGTCTREGCGAEFCTSCSSTPHDGACNTPLLATPTKRKEPPLVVGSKQSKRNLRRL